MPRLSLWKEGTHSADYKFQDRRIKELFTASGVGINVHKYLGPLPQGDTGDFTQNTGLNPNELTIQDVLFLENRDRKYDKDIYNMRGHYTVQDTDFNLSQFGLFITNDTIFMTFHINDMVERMGRKIMAGDVFELPHVRDYNPLDPNDEIPIALRKYYVVQETTRAAEGFAPTWWPHLWRVKLNPMTDSQEFKDILNTVKVDTNGDGTEDTPIADLLSNIDKYQNINNAIIQQAEVEVPKSGYDTTNIYVKSAYTPNQTDNTPQDKVHGYLTGDGIPPNATSVSAGINFPLAPDEGDYYLRLDYVPNRLFRYDGKRWIKIEDAVRTNLTPGPDNHTLRSGFVNDTSTYTNDSGTHHTLQGLSKILKPTAD